MSNKCFYSEHDPWRHAPAWAVELGAMVGHVLNKENKLMALEDDLNNALTSLATGFAAEHTAVAAELDAITKLLAAGGTPPALVAAVTQGISNINAITGQMALDAAALTASIPAATTVPTPVVTPPATPPTVVPPTIASPPVTDPSASPPSTPPASATTTTT